MSFEGQINKNIFSIEAYKKIEEVDSSLNIDSSEGNTSVTSGDNIKEETGIWAQEENFLLKNPNKVVELIDFLKENPQFIQVPSINSMLSAGLSLDLGSEKIIEFLNLERITQCLKKPEGNNFLLNVLQVAIERNHMDLIKILHKADFDFDQAYLDRRIGIPQSATSPLLHIILIKKLHILEFLLDHSIISYHRLLPTFLDFPALISSYPKYVHQIIISGTDLNLQGRDGKTLIDHILTMKNPLQNFWASFTYLTETQHPFSENQKKIIQIAIKNKFSYLEGLIQNRSSFPDNFHDAVTIRNMALLLGDATIEGLKDLEGGLLSETLNFLSQGIAHVLEKVDGDGYFKPETREVLNLEMAVQDDKVMQDFDSESLSMGGDHSQKVKVPPIESDSESKGCVNLSSSTAVSRLNACKTLLESSSLLKQKMELPAGICDIGMPTYVEKLSQEVLESIQNLKIGDSFLIPSGWLSFGYSHAILIRCKRIVTDCVVFQLFTTGGGSSKYHQSAIFNDKQMVHTTRYYAATDDQLKSSGLIQSLLEIRVLGFMGNHSVDYTFNEEDLYHILNPYQIDGETVKKHGFFPQKGFMQNQLSGTCAMRCILAFLRYELGDLEYKKFLASLKKNVTELAIDKFGDKIAESTSLKRVLGKALPNLFRSEKKIADSYNLLELSPEQKERFYREEEAIADHLISLANKFSKHVKKIKPTVFIPGDQSLPIMTLIVAKHMETYVLDKCPQKEEISSRGITHSLSRFCPKEMLKSVDALQETLYAINHLGRIFDKITFDRRDIIENTLMRMGRGLIQAQLNKQDHPFFKTLKLYYSPPRCIEEISNSVGLLMEFHEKKQDICSASTTIALHYALVSAWIIATTFEETLERPPEGLLSNYRLSGEVLERLYVYEQGANLIANKQLEEDYHTLLTFLQQDKYKKQTIFDFEKLRRTNPFKDIIPIETNSGDYLLSQTYLSDDKRKQVEEAYTKAAEKNPYVPALDPKVWETCWTSIHGLPQYLKDIRFISEASVVLNPKQKVRAERIYSKFDSLVIYLPVKETESGTPYFQPSIRAIYEDWLQSHKNKRLKTKGALPKDEKISYQNTQPQSTLAIKPDLQNAAIRTPCFSFRAPMEIRSGTSLGELGIPFLLNYFKQHPDLLIESHFRTLFAATLYQPFKLKEALNKYLNLNTAALDFFQFAIQTLKQQEQCEIEIAKTQEAIVFLFDQQQRFLQWLPQDQAETLLPNIQEDIREYQKKIQNPTLLNSLSQSLVDSYQIKETLTNQEIQEVLTQYYEIIRNYPPNKDGMSLASLRSAGYSFAKHFPQIIKFFNEEAPRNRFLNNFLRQRGIDISFEAKWTSSGFPHFQSTSNGYCFEVDLMKREILRNGRSLNKKEKKLYEGLHYKRVFESASIDWINYGNYFEGVFNSECVRIYMEGTEIKEIQRSIEGKWHRMVTQEPQPLPKKLIGGDDLQYWLNLENGEMTVINKETQTTLLRITRNGYFKLPHCKDAFEWINLKLLPQANVFLQFDSSAILWRNKKTQELLFQFPTYTDMCGKSLEFELKTSYGKQRWAWKQHPHLFLSSNQSIDHMPDQTNFLVLESINGKRECLVSVKNIDSDPVKGLYLHIPLKVNKLTTRNSFENLILAYHTLTHASLPSDYEQALKYLIEGYKFESYTAEELKILGWIFKPSKEHPDHSGHNTALKLYAAWLVKDNFSRHPNGHEKKASSASNDYPDLYDTKEDWVTFWQSGFASLLLRKLVTSYKEHKKKLPISLRIESILAPHEIKKLQYEESVQKVPDCDRLKEKVKTKEYIQPLSLRTVLKKMEENCSLSEIKYHTRPGDGIIKNFSFFYTKFSTLENDQEFKEAEQFLLNMIFTKNEEALSYILILYAILYKNRLHPDLIVNDYIKAINEFITEGKKIENDKKLDEKKFYPSSFASVLIRSCIENIKTPFIAPVEFLPSPDWLDSQNIPRLPEKNSTLHYSPKKSADLFDSLHQKYFKENNTISSSKFSPFSLKTEDPFIEESIKKLNKDYNAGCEKNAQLKRSYFKDYSQVDQFAAEIKDTIQQDYKTNSARLSALEKEILFVANKLPEDHKKAFEAKVSRHSGIKPMLTMKECIALFLQSDSEEYKRMTYLETAEEIQSLHKKIGRYQELSLHSRQQQKILDLVENLNTCSSQSKKQSILSTLGEELKQKSLITDKDPVAFLTFQYCLGIYLRQDQIDGLHDMLQKKGGEFRNVLLQRIQGGGKTLVFGHLMALLKADGKHLSVHIPPTSLCHSSLYDMKHLSQDVFGQKEKFLEFNDHPALFSQEYLDEMTEILQNAILNREYITITQESLRAMRCKYLKVFYTIMQIEDKIKKLFDIYKQTQDPEIKKRIDSLSSSATKLKYKNYDLNDILKILRQYAVFTFDEVDMAFDPHKELNMPVGDVFPPERTEGMLIAKVLRLAAEGKDPKTDRTLLNFKEKTKQNDEDFKKIGQYIAEKLVSSKKWQQLFKADTAERQTALRKYFQNASCELPAFVKEMKQDQNGLGSQAAELIILTHNLIAERWLQQRLKKNVDEHHGISYACEMHKAKVSIPYIGNMNPALGSEFSNKHVMLINTFISYAISGLNSSQTLELIKNLQEKGRKEYLEKRIEYPSLSLKETETAKTFAEIGAGLLYSINLKDTKEIERVQQCLNSNLDVSRKLIFEYVLDEIIPKVELYPTQICSHGQNTASMAKAFVGYSGSLDNPNLAPPHTTIQLEKGTNGQTIDLIISKFDEVHTFSSNLLEELIKKHPQKENIRAIIDVGAQFRGIPNQDVAERISRFLYSERLPCDGVLYFNTKSEKLMIMYASPPYLTKELSGTDPETIESETGYKLENLFIYYDQIHTIGTNIALSEKAIGVLTISEDTPIHKLVQGTRRLRGLDKEQKIVFAVQENLPSLISTKIKKETPITSKDLVLFTHLNEAEAMREDNLLFCLQKMENIVQQFVLDSLYDYLGIYQELLQTTSYLFVKNIAMDLYETYAKKRKEVDMRQYLQQVQQCLLDPLHDLETKGILTKGILTILYMQIEDVIEEALPTLRNQIEVSEDFEKQNKTFHEQNMESSHVQFREQQNSQVKQNEQQNENEKLNENLAEIEYNIYKNSPAYTEKNCWDDELLTCEFKSLPTPIPKEHDHIGFQIWKANETLERQLQKKCFVNLLDDELLVTSNFSKSLLGRINLVGAFKKTPAYGLFLQDKNEWRLLLGSLEDTKFFETLIKEEEKLPEGRSAHLIALPDTLLLSAGRNLSDDPKIKRLIVQVLFYSGQLNVLRQKQWCDELAKWLKDKDNIEVYRDFFENVALGHSREGYSQSRIYRILHEVR